MFLTAKMGFKREYREPGNDPMKNKINLKITNLLTHKSFREIYASLTIQPNKYTKTFFINSISVILHISAYVVLFYTLALVTRS